MRSEVLLLGERVIDSKVVLVRLPESILLIGSRDARLSGYLVHQLVILVVRRRPQLDLVGAPLRSHYTVKSSTYERNNG